MAQRYAASVGDEMILERVLGALSPMDREAVDRALADGGYGSGIDQDDVDEAFERGERAGYGEGFTEGEKEGRRRALAEKNDGTPPQSKPA